MPPALSTRRQVINPDFRKKLPWLHVDKDLHVVAQCEVPLALDRSAASARLAHPQAKLYSVEVSIDLSSPVGVMFAGKDYVHPCTARVLGVHNQCGGFFEALKAALKFNPRLPARRKCRNRTRPHSIARG